MNYPENLPVEPHFSKEESKHISKMLTNSSPLTHDEQNIVNESMVLGKSIVHELFKEKHFSSKTMEHLESLSENIVLGNSSTNDGGVYIEGLIMSYPASKIEEFIEKIIQKGIDSGEVHRVGIEENEDSPGGNTHPVLGLWIVGGVTFVARLEYMLKDKLKFYGWYVGEHREKQIKMESRFETLHVFTIEPIFPIENSKNMEFTIKTVNSAKTGLFYHVAFSNDVPDILKFGLHSMPSTSPSFTHPDRVYLFNDLDEARSFVDFYVNKGQLDILGTLEREKQVNTRMIGNSTKTGNTPKPANEKYQQHENRGVAILSVDLKKMLEDGKSIRLYHDNRYQPEHVAYFTDRSIPPKYITNLPEEFVKTSN